MHITLKEAINIINKDILNGNRYPAYKKCSLEDMTYIETNTSYELYFPNSNHCYVINKHDGTAELSEWLRQAIIDGRKEIKRGSLKEVL